MPPILVDCTPSNGGDLQLSGNTVVGSTGVDVSLWSGNQEGGLIGVKSLH